MSRTPIVPREEAKVMFVEISSGAAADRDNPTRGGTVVAGAVVSQGAPTAGGWLAEGGAVGVCVGAERDAGVEGADELEVADQAFREGGDRGVVGGAVVGA